MQIKVDVTDWEQEYIQEETQILIEDDLVKLSTQMPASKVARMYLVSREKKQSPDDLLRPNKVLLNVGGATDLASVIVRRKKDVTLSNGKEFQIREYVGSGAEDEEDTFVKVESDEAAKRALDYLLNIVPGYVMGRLKIIAHCGGGR